MASLEGEDKKAAEELMAISGLPQQGVEKQKEQEKRKAPNRVRQPPTKHNDYLDTAEALKLEARGGRPAKKQKSNASASAAAPAKVLPQASVPAAVAGTQSDAATGMEELVDDSVQEGEAPQGNDYF